MKWPPSSKSTCFFLFFSASSPTPGTKSSFSGRSTAFTTQNWVANKWSVLIGLDRTLKNCNSLFHKCQVLGFSWIQIISCLKNVPPSLHLNRNEVHSNEKVCRGVRAPPSMHRSFFHSQIGMFQTGLSRRLWHYCVKVRKRNRSGLKLA